MILAERCTSRGAVHGCAADRRDGRVDLRLTRLESDAARDTRDADASDAEGGSAGSALCRRSCGLLRYRLCLLAPCSVVLHASSLWLDNTLAERSSF